MEPSSKVGIKFDLFKRGVSDRRLGTENRVAILSRIGGKVGIDVEAVSIGARSKHDP